MKKKPLYEYRLVPGVFSLQIDVPHKDYGECDYFISEEMYIWMKLHGMSKYEYAGGRSGGDGYTNGITNRESVYIIKNVTEEDGTAFQIQFPFCKVHVQQQYECN